MNDARKNFGRRLRRAREARGLTAQQVADRSGVAVTAISHFETGRRGPSIDNLYALCIALAVSADELLGIGYMQGRGAA